MIKRIITGTILFLCSMMMAYAGSVRISQIDTKTLLIDQQIRLYLSVTDPKGKPIENLRPENFAIFESADKKNFQAIPKIESFKSGTNYEEGISFLLLVDNSGSMYKTMGAQDTKKDSNRRITYAKKAVLSFLESIKNPKDRIGLAVYNKFYQTLTPPTNDRNQIRQNLEKINRSVGDPMYTEIYGSLRLAMKDFRSIRGRKAIIILSDGENRPSWPHSKKEHPIFGKKVIKYQEPLQDMQMEGISLYAINFGKRGTKQDKNLRIIARESGGATFNAHNENQLSRIYLKIMDQVLKEYVLSYKATMDPTSRKYVRVRYSTNAVSNETSRFYFSSTLFGTPPKELNYLYLIGLLLSPLLLALLTKVKFEKESDSSVLEVIGKNPGKIEQTVIALDQAQTIIGSSPNADMTIAGMPDIEEQHATVMFDEQINQYTIVGDGKLMVNNNPITTKILEPGDLININGVTMVFDQGEDDQTEKE